MRELLGINSTAFIVFSIIPQFTSFTICLHVSSNLIINCGASHPKMIYNLKINPRHMHTEGDERPANARLFRW